MIWMKWLIPSCEQMYVGRERSKCDNSKYFNASSDKQNISYFPEYSKGKREENHGFSI